MCPAPHSGNSARILLGPSVPVEVTSVARRPSLQRGSAVRGIPWFPGMSVEDSEPVTGGAGSVTACSDTVPVRTAVDGPQSILGQGSSPARLSRLCFHSRDAGSIPGRGAMISRAAWCSQKNKRVCFLHLFLLPDAEVPRKAVSCDPSKAALRVRVGT